MLTWVMFGPRTTQGSTAPDIDNTPQLPVFCRYSLLSKPADIVYVYKVKRTSQAHLHSQWMFLNAHCLYSCFENVGWKHINLAGPSVSRTDLAFHTWRWLVTWRRNPIYRIKEAGDRVTSKFFNKALTTRSRESKRGKNDVSRRTIPQRGRREGAGGEWGAEERSGRGKRNAQSRLKLERDTLLFEASLYGWMTPKRHNILSTRLNDAPRVQQLFVTLSACLARMIGGTAIPMKD
jgi:hypothetical protein